MILGFTLDGSNNESARDDADLLQKSRELLARMEAAKVARDEARAQQVRAFKESMERSR
jgi:predicted outer membrane protein